MTEGEETQMIAALGIGIIGTVLVVVLIVAVVMWLLRRA